MEPELKLVPEVDAEKMASVIAQIGDGVERLLRAGLNRRALQVLIKDSSGVPVYQIAKVLDALSTLRTQYTTLATKKPKAAK